MGVLVRVTEYMGYLVIEGPEGPHEDWVPKGEGRIGCIVMNTHVNLGVSPEAIAALSKVPTTGDALSEVTWFKSHERGSCFGWLGGRLSLLDAKTIQFPRGEGIHEYVSIANETPNGAKAAIENRSPDNG